MRTPLQVTFMATLVAAGGTPPRDRWRLFHEYFETIYKREQQKAVGTLAEVLSSQKTLIECLHFEVGFWLQVRGEQSKGTDALMSEEQFQRILDHLLERQGWEG